MSKKSENRSVLEKYTQELQASEERFHGIISQTADGVVIVDQDGIIRFCNPAAETFFGFGEDDLLGSHFGFPVVAGATAEIDLAPWARNNGARIAEMRVVETTWEAQPAFLASLRDITHRKLAETALRESEARFRALAETNFAAIFIYQDNAIVYANPGAEILTGYTRQEMLGSMFWSIIHPEDRSMVRERGIQRQLGQPVPDRYEIKIHTKSGEERWVDMSAGMIQFEGRAAVLGIAFDVTERTRAELALHESEERYALAVRGANDGIWDWDLRTGHVYYSPRWKSMLGFSDDEINADIEAWFDQIHPEDANAVRLAVESHIEGLTSHFESEHRLLHRDGDYRWFLARGLAIRDSQKGEAGESVEGARPHRIAGSLTDISGRKAAEERLLHDALHDTLTGLPNRAYFMEQLKRSLDRAQRGDYMAAVLFLDLDRFKMINDSLGHAIGDNLLETIARRLQGCLRPGDFISRFGGDEFAILVDDIGSIDEAIHVSHRIQREVSSPLGLHGHEVFTTASIGIAAVTPDYIYPEDLLRDADIALYRAKANGKAKHVIFDEEMHSRAVALMQLEAELRQAIERSDLQVYYQPIVSLDNNEISGVEALLRWNHRERGLIWPDDFVPLAEETGLILPIGEWVLRQACAQTKAWHDAGYSQLRVAVNLSSRQLQDESLPHVIKTILKETGLAARFLELEITESTALKDLKRTTRLLRELSALNVKISIDDFGNSYIPLGHLKHFPVNRLKIDQSLVADITSNDDDAAIISAIIAMTHLLKLNVIAEGVQTEPQRAFLASKSCDEIQGYLVNPALPARDITRLLQGELDLRK